MNGTRSARQRRRPFSGYGCEHGRRLRLRRDVVRMVHAALTLASYLGPINLATASSSPSFTLSFWPPRRHARAHRSRSRLIDLSLFARGGDTNPANSTDSPATAQAPEATTSTTIKKKKSRKKKKTTTTTTTATQQSSSSQTPVIETKKKTTTSPTPAALASSRSITARRIQQEWKDLVEAGMGFDWRKGRPVVSKRSKKKAKKAKDQLDKLSTISKDAEEQMQQQQQQQQQYIWIGPLSMQNLYIWHFSFLGVEGSPYENGIYHGRMVLPLDYPGSPPQVQVWTPSGRFVVRTNICLSASSYHPETWTASWTLRTLTQALRLHMLTNANEIGGISSCSYEDRVQYAKDSQSWKIRYGSIVIDHEEMMRRGLFPINVDEEDVIQDETTQDTQQKLASIQKDEPEIVLFNGTVRLALWIFVVWFVWLNLW